MQTRWAFIVTRETKAKGKREQHAARQKTILQQNRIANLNKTRQSWELVFMMHEMIQAPQKTDICQPSQSFKESTKTSQKLYMMEKNL